jgi:hypothetical protein
MANDMRSGLAEYWSGHAPDLISADAVFHDLSSGQDFAGAQQINGMLHWFYNVAFDARAEPKIVILDESSGAAAVAGRVVGRHVGEFAGVPPSNRDINVQLCVTYRIVDDQIQEAWVYFNLPEFLRQVGAA